MEAAPIRVLVVEDHRGVRDGLALVINARKAWRWQEQHPPAKKLSSANDPTSC